MIFKIKRDTFPEECNITINIDNSHFIASDKEMEMDLEKGYHKIVVRCTSGDSQKYKLHLYKKRMHRHILSVSTALYNVQDEYEIYVSKNDCVFYVEYAVETTYDSMKNSIQLPMLKVNVKNVKAIKLTKRIHLLDKSEKFKYIFFQMINISLIVLTVLLLSSPYVLIDIYLIYNPSEQMANYNYTRFFKTPEESFWFSFIEWLILGLAVEIYYLYKLNKWIKQI